jgi:hypothetical protein
MRSVLRFKDSDYPFGICTLFWQDIVQLLTLMNDNDRVIIEIPQTFSPHEPRKKPGVNSGAPEG